ncbi:MAG: homogentisate 1,2-dioxygenase, partial [Marmoricola sp.]
MAYYRSVGAVPRTRHTAFRDDQGNLRYEELMGEEGFSSDSSLLYHAGVPSAVVDSQVWDLPDLTTVANHPLKPRHLKLHDLDWARSPGVGVDTVAGVDAVTGRRLVMGNGD